MASHQELVQGELLKVQKIVNLTYATCPAITIQYCGPKTFAAVDVAAGGDMTFTADNTNGTTTVDPSVGCAGGVQTALGIIDLSTPNAIINTFGELEAWVNSYGGGNWRCISHVPASLSTDNTIVTHAAAAGEVTLAGGLTLYLDPAATGYYAGFCITNEKFTSRPTGGWATFTAGWVKNDNCVNSLCYLDFILTSVGDGTFTVYSVKDLVSSQLYTEAFATATTETHGAAPTPDTPWISANEGERLVVLFDGVAAISAGTIYAIGTTKNRIGAVVHGGNYTGCV